MQSIYSETTTLQVRQYNNNVTENKNIRFYYTKKHSWEQLICKLMTILGYNTWS